MIQASETTGQCLSFTKIAEGSLLFKPFCLSPSAVNIAQTHGLKSYLNMLQAYQSIEL